MRRLGAGAMGEVYLAHDTLLDRPVAVKLIAQGAVDEGRRERFRVETRAIARLQHPNVVTVYRVGEVRRRPYLVSEYVRGRSLRELPKPLAWEEVLRIGIGLARGLAAAHRRGVLHRDIKPANVMVTEDGEVKLLDFGLAKIFDEVREPLDSPEPSPPAPVEPEARSATRSAPGREPTAAASASEPTLPAPDGLPATGAEPPAHPGAMSSEQRALTLSGTLLGTPLYMAPEIWRGEPASPRADVYSLGVVLHELCAGRTPHHDLSMHELARAVPTRRAAPLATVVPGVDAHLAAVIDRCLALSPEERFASGDALREALERLEEGRRGEDAVGGRPYPGLHPFEPADRSMFFGRGVEVRTILDRLRAEPLVVVAGDSGVGKSSLCRAGVLPRVMEGALGGGSWTVVTLVPGRDPLGALAGALGPHLSVDEAALVEEMRAEPRALGRRLGASAGTRGLLVFVDQMEELLTLSAEAEARAAADALAVLAGGLPGVRVLGTARGDFLTRLASLPGIGPLLSGALYLLAPLGEAELREAIVGPARARGFAFESEPLVDVLVQAGRTEGALPLLQFALAELWEARDPERRVIPAAALERMGGVTGALARHADNVLARLLPEERAAARHVLLRLVTVEGTRARRRESELVEAGDAKGRAARVAIEALVSGRLVVAREAEGAEHVGTYELAHEALTTGWETLRRWLVDDVEARAARERLEQAAREWVRLGRPAEGLWNERQLAEVAGLDQGSWMDAERAFVATSRRVASRRRWIRLGAIAALPLTGLLVYGGVRWRDHSERSRQVTLHVRVADEALQGIEDRVSQAEALRQRAFGAFDAGRGAEGEQRWAEALVVQQEVAQRYREAAEALEAALLRDTERADVRRRLGEVILQQILLAEQEHRPAAREELTRRLATFDDSGELRARLSAPARLGVVTRPPGAEVWIERYEDEGGRLRPGPARPLGRTPLEDVPIESGSYRLAMRVPGRPQIHETVLLGRGERYVVEVDLPERIPEGFVYVPAGRFLFGSRDDEAVRANFLVAQPLHQTRTGAFLISRYEVSYGEWLEFLRDLPPAEQERRRPRVDSFSRGTIELARTAGGRWRLQYIPPSLSSPFVYTVMEGERFHYEQRTLRADQDWLRFPVSGVSWEDSLAYLGWLRRTGRVPGARFCEVREWERAARGADGRSYPHGERLEPDDTNYDQTYGQRELAFGPDEVGAHPASASPFGVEDMAGNVREWVHWRHVPEEPHYGGGCFYYDRLTSRVYVHATDLRSKPAQREPLIGLRVCADAR